MREKLFTMRMSPEETERLEKVAAHYALTSAAVIRMLIKREADQIVDVTPKPAKKPAKVKK